MYQTNSKFTCVILDFPCVVADHGNASLFPKPELKSPPMSMAVNWNAHISVTCVT